MGWLDLLSAFAVFFLSHSLLVRPPIRPKLEAVLGRRGFAVSYSLISLGVLTWLIAAAGRAPFVLLWPWAAWQSLVVLVVMLPVCMLLAVSIGQPNPFSFGGARNHAFRPERPGIVRLTRHPLLLALALWAFAHILPNGDLAHVALFGTFAVFALLGGRLVDRRKQREMGDEWWQLRDAVNRSPAFAGWRLTDLGLRLAVGFGLYLVLIWLHPYLFGVSPLS